MVETGKHLSHPKETDPAHLEGAVTIEVYRANIARFPVFSREV